jgi:DNA-binding CsgD family transcriptional regulator
MGPRTLDLNAVDAMPHDVLGIFRHLRRVSRALDGVSFSYHVTPPFTSMTNNLPIMVFASARAFSLRNANLSVKHAVGAVHDMVLSQGRSTAYSAIVDLAKAIEPQIVGLVQQGIADLGIGDELMIPCYGHHAINGCMCFSFPYQVTELGDKTREFLEGTAQVAHQRLVSAYFARVMSRQTKLSRREAEIIGWIAKSKSSTDIATIMNISVATVETYIRRIFKKLNVNNRMSAVIAVLASGQLHS